MKVAHIVSTFLPHVGGMGKVCFEEARALATDHEVTVITLDYGCCEDGKDNNFPFNICRLKPVFRLGDGGWVVNFSRELADFDLVHLHYPFYGALGSLIRAKKLIGFPLVVTYHMDPQGRGLLKCLQNLYDRFYGKRIFDLADKVMAVDHDYFARSKFGKKINEKKLSVLPNGVQLESFKLNKDSWESLGLPELKNKKTILFVGNFLAVKNLEFLFKILPKIREDSVLLVVGGGYEEADLKSFIKGTPYEKRVLFVGFINDENRLSRFYSAADITAIPSKSESFSLVATEAMASGSIVLANDIPGIKGRIDHGIDGFLADLDDGEDWISKINEIFSLSPEKRESISLSARGKAEKYSWTNHNIRLKNIYSEFI